MAEEIKDTTATEGGDLSGTAPADEQVKDDVTQGTGEDKGKEIDGTKVFNNGFAKGAEKGVENFLKELGVTSKEELTQKINDINSQSEEEETELSKLQKSVADLQSKLEEKEKVEKELKQDASKKEVQSKLEEEFGYSLTPSYTKLIEGETAEELETSARALFEELGEIYKDVNKKKEPAGVGASTKPSGTESLSKEQFKKLSVTEKTRLIQENPSYKKYL